MHGLDDLPSLDDFGRQLDEVAARDAERTPRWRRRPGTSMLLAAVLGVGVAGTAAAATLVALRDAPVTGARDAPITPPPGPGNLGAAHQTSPTAFRTHLDPAEADRSGTDWASLRSLPISGTPLRGWTFTRRAKRCLALPDPIAEGYGVTCKTAKAIKDGEATVLVLVPPNAGVQSIVGALVAAGDIASLQTPAGGSATLNRTGNAYAGTAPAGSRLTTAGRSQVIDPPANALVEPVTPSQSP